LRVTCPLALQDATLVGLETPDCDPFGGNLAQLDLGISPQGNLQPLGSSPLRFAASSAVNVVSLRC
jgi:hypothetical protein